MRYLRIFAVAVFALGLSGCLGSRQPLNPPQLVTASESDIAIQLFMQATLMVSRYYGYPTLAYEEIRARAARSGLSTLPFMPPIQRRATPRLTNFVYDFENAAAFRGQIDSTITLTGLLGYYIRTGGKAAQIICRNYLQGLDERNQYLDFLQKEFGVAYTLANGILIAASANGTLLHALGISRSAVDGAIDAYQEYRFLAIDRDAARLLVETAQEKYTEHFIDKAFKRGTVLKVNNRDVPFDTFTFADAINAINVIEFQCTRAGIRNLITRAVNNTPTNMAIDPDSGAMVFKSNDVPIAKARANDAANSLVPTVVVGIPK